MKFFINKIWLYFTLYLSYLFFFLYIWLDRYFGEVDIEQFLFFLLLGFDGLIDTDDYIINKFIELCILLPFLLLLITKILEKIFKKIPSSKNFKRFINFIPNLILIFSVVILSTKLSFFSWTKSLKSNEDFIAKKYIKPDNIITNPKKDNLILIYVESFEKAFSDVEVFNENLIQDIDESSLNGKSIEYFNELKYTNWTIASIVASQCGIPLKPISIFDTKNKGKHQRHIFGLKTFLPKAVCLGDILKRNGYNNIFINGVDLNFVGTGLFFNNHGYDELYDKNEFKKKSLNFDPGSWGGAPHDSFLFDFAKKRILDFKDNQKPFNLTLLTTDTHAPNGFLDKKCKINGSQFNDVVKCTSYNLKNFVKFINDELPYNTKIIIIGDHLFPEPNKIGITESVKERSIYNMFISNDRFIFKRNRINHYDLFPTILNFINFEFENNKLGLGFSALKEFKIKEYENHIEYLNKNIQNRSKTYENFYN